MRGSHIPFDSWAQRGAITLTDGNVADHDAIAEHFPELVFPNWRQRLPWTLKTWLANRAADRILTVSQSAKAEIVAYLNIHGDRIDVIFHPKFTTPLLAPCKAIMVVRVDEHGRAITDGPQVEIGGNDRYVSMCRKHFKEKFYR